MRFMLSFEPPCERNQSAKETSSRFRMSCIPPSGSTSAHTMGEVPSASAFAALSMGSSCGVVKKAFRPWNGAPIFTSPTRNRKSSSRTSPSLLQKVWVWSLGSRFWMAPLRAMSRKRLK